MPSTRKRAPRRSLAEPWKVDFLLTGCVKRPDGGNSCKPYLWEAATECCFADERALIPAWEAARGELLPRFIQDNPGRRPFAWWEFDCTTGPRRGAGGTGFSADVKYGPSLAFGVPDPGNWWQGVAPGDPPLFESQAAYLQRHGLLNEAEKRWLAQHPGALEPEKIEYRQENPRHGY